MPPSRREFLQQLGAIGALSALASCAENRTPDPVAGDGTPPGGPGFSDGTPAPAGFDFPTGTRLPFAHGVASGDPMADRVIIWTRITEVTPSAASIPVAWLVASDPAMTQVLARGTQLTTAARDWTVKVDVTGLAPATTYYYRFTALGTQSMIGRMRTAPDSAVEEIRLAVLSCSSYWSSYWSGLGHIADRNDLDLVVHLGDYLYDFVDQDEGVRARNDIKDTASVDYRDWLDITELRRRYALWRSDPNLLRAHQQHSWFVVWDNHDIDEIFGNELPTALAGAKSSTTLAITTQVFHEWLPTRPVRADGSGAYILVDDGRYPEQSDPRFVYRHLRYGPLLDVFGIDSQIYLPNHGLDVDSSHLAFGNSLLNRPQFEWLTQGMLASAQAGVRWRFVANQTWLAPVDIPDVVDGVPTAKLGISRWSDYTEERAALFQYLRGANPAGTRVFNTVFASGDAHGNLGSDLIERGALLGNAYVSGLPTPNLRQGSTSANFPAGWGRAAPASLGPLNARGDSVGVEFAPTSMGRGGADEIVANALRQPPGSTQTVLGARAIEAAVISGNKNVQFIEWVDHGYGIVSLTMARAIFEYWWQDKLTPGAPDVLGNQMISWADDDASLVAPHYRDQLNSVTAFGMTVTPTQGTRTAAPAPPFVALPR